jgi:hypothetical protein
LTLMQNLKFGQLHVHDDPHPISTSLSRCSTGRSCASKESSFTLQNIQNNWMKNIVWRAALFVYF